MIKANFYQKNGLYCGFIISGHAGGKYGQDIVCAGVSSAVMLTVNTLTDFLVCDCDVKVGKQPRLPRAYILTKDPFAASGGGSRRYKRNYQKYLMGFQKGKLSC